MGSGILDLAVADTPTAVIDFETTGLTPGPDRVVEVSVIRREPGTPPRMVLDTLVNPRRPMAATEIHGITDADVADAPAFEEVAGDVARAVSECVFAAYNVYFDKRFFDYEMSRAGLRLDPPHICLMYLRPLLGLGRRCSLGDACQSHGVPYSGSHMAADDAESSVRLMEFYLGVMRTQGIRFFYQLSTRGTYKFLHSFERDVLTCDLGISACVPDRLRPRNYCCGEGARVLVPATAAERAAPTRNGVAMYWDALKSAVADLEIDDEEVEQLRRIVDEYGVRQEQIRMLHARAFGSIITQFTRDDWLDEDESRKLKRLHQCLGRLGWAPGD